MTTPIDPALTRALQPIAEALIRPEDVRRDREHDRTHSGGRLRAEEVRGTLPPNAAGVVQGGSVQVPPSDLSDAENLSDHLSDVEDEVATKLTNPPGPTEGAVLVIVDGTPTWQGGAALSTWSVLSNGDPADPALIWFDGDVIMVQGG